jgi:opacity protein-like surface antigen
MKKALLAVLLVSAVSASYAADVSPTCQKYFDSVENFMEMAKEHEAAKAQLATLKTQYEQSKTQIAALPPESQEQACKPALDAMEQVTAQLQAAK